MSFLQLVTKNYKPPAKEVDFVDAVPAEEPKKSGRPSIADRLIEYIVDDIELFVDQRNEGYARLPTGQILKLKSRIFQAYLKEAMYSKEGKALNLSAGKNIANTFEAIALVKQKKYSLSVRVSQQERVFYYDLGNGRVVKIDSMGCNILEDAPIAFRSFSHQINQVLPVFDQKTDDFLQFFNLKNKKNHLLLIAYLVSCFVPDIPHPVLVLSGDQGSAKSTFFKLIKRLIDPSYVELFCAPKNLNEFIQIEDHHYCIYLDNLTDFPDWLSDACCRGCTGEGFSKRRLFSDDEDIFYNFKRCLGINGINQVINRPDLLDRSLLFDLERIPNHQRKKDQEIMRQYNSILPQTLGSLLTIFSKAINCYDKVKIDSSPRMADFTHWGCAVALALGYTELEFLELYYKNIKLQTLEALDASPIASVIIAYMTNKTTITKTSSELYGALCALAETLHINTRLKAWPKDPKWLWKRIKEVRPNLANIGITAEKTTNDRFSYISLSKDR